MANLLELAQKMGVTATPTKVEKKNNGPAKRRPWLEEEETHIPTEKINTHLAEDKVANTKTFSIEEVINLQKLAGDLEKTKPAIKKGELTKPESKIERIDKKLEKIELKTDKLIAKSNKGINMSLTRHEHVISTSLTSHEQKTRGTSKKIASLVEYYSLKGLPKIIVNAVKQQAQYETNLKKWIAVIDTEDLKEKSKKSPNHIAVQILRLQEQNWFQVLNSTNSGMRVIEISDPEIYSLSI
jgi:hypothetical protein